jgi:hypothetical protein
VIESPNHNHDSRTYGADARNALERELVSRLMATRAAAVARPLLAPSHDAVHRRVPLRCRGRQIAVEGLLQ